MSNPETLCPFCCAEKDRRRPMVYRCESPIGIDPREWTSQERSRQCWVEEGKLVRTAITTLRDRVSELDRLEITGVYQWGNQVSAMVRLPPGSTPARQKTLGQAIPTKGTR